MPVLCHAAALFSRVGVGGAGSISWLKNIHSVPPNFSANTPAEGWHAILGVSQCDQTRLRNPKSEKAWFSNCIASMVFGNCFFVRSYGPQTTGPLLPRYPVIFKFTERQPQPPCKSLPWGILSQQQKTWIYNLQRIWVNQLEEHSPAQCNALLSAWNPSCQPVLAVPAIWCLRLWNQTGVQTCNFNCSHDHVCVDCHFFWIESFRKRVKGPHVWGNVFFNSKPTCFWFHNWNFWFFHLDN